MQGYPSKPWYIYIYIYIYIAFLGAYRGYSRIIRPFTKGCIGPILRTSQMLGLQEIRGQGVANVLHALF